ncbi:glutamate--cysteine ligase [Kribbia dieselivorans]|uniref:glutamate--cysteine ligase n=1 Tax=Kribbia dieselivorans TaxID=331526 RepID=UPI000837F2C7|nr:glutamate--cysteine ligase [Kribbia dieselivorans]
MGREIAAQTYPREQRRRYRERVRQDLDVFADLLAHHDFDADRRMTGVEVEMSLVGPGEEPAMINESVLAAIGQERFQSELGRYNIELNLPPRELGGASLREFEDEFVEALMVAERGAAGNDAHVALVGILPTLRDADLTADWITPSNRFIALNDAIMAARGEEIDLDITGPDGERVRRYSDNIAPESACTSVQLHLQVSPDEFASYWNAAQAITGVQVALGANSPFLFGRRLHAETRIALFRQSIDTRTPELRNQGVRPRAVFGERWITSIFDLFEENVAYYTSLLPELSDEDPVAELASGAAPLLTDLRLHNGTIYRWNRPIYDVVNGRAHLRVENRVLPSGPTAIDVTANAAFYHGMVEALARADRPMWSRMPFAVAERNFEAGARGGLDAEVRWPGLGKQSVNDLVLQELLPLAQTGLESLGADGPTIDRYLGVLEGRCARDVNGAIWQSRAVERFEERGESRASALAQMVRLYREHSLTNAPVHTWPLP